MDCQIVEYLSPAACRAGLFEQGGPFRLERGAGDDPPAPVFRITGLGG
jgi:hypothetical protein